MSREVIRQVNSHTEWAVKDQLKLLQCSTTISTPGDYTLLVTVYDVWGSIQSVLNRHPRTTQILIHTYIQRERCGTNSDSFVTRLKMMITHYGLIEEDLYSIEVRDEQTNSGINFVIRMEFKDMHTVHNSGMARIHI